MGYRSGFITNDLGFEFPTWFVDKYEDNYNFGTSRGDYGLPLSTKFEVKRKCDDLEKDLVKAIKELKSDDPWGFKILGIWLHEDGEFDRVVYTKDGVYDNDNWDYNRSEPKQQTQ